MIKTRECIVWPFGMKNYKLNVGATSVCFIYSSFHNTLIYTTFEIGTFNTSAIKCSDLPGMARNFYWENSSY